MPPRSPPIDPEATLSRIGRLSRKQVIGGHGRGRTSRRRLITTAGSATTNFLYDGDQVIAEYDNAGNVLRRYVPTRGENEPVVWYEGSGTTDRRFLIPDERGSIIAVTDNSANVMGSGPNTYDEYGVPGSSNLGRFQYTGQMYIPEIGLYHYKARAYSPTLGRFMQTDPIGYGDGVNWYAYAGNDPINGVDPSGRQCVWDDGSFDSLEGSDSDSSPGSCQNDGGTWWDPQLFQNAHIPDGAWTSPNSGLSWFGGSTLYVSATLLSFPEDGAGAPADYELTITASRQNTVSGITVTARMNQVLGCIGTAWGNNWQGLTLDGLGWAAYVAFPEGSVAAGIAGSTLGLVGIASATASNNGPFDGAFSGAFAYTGKQTAVAAAMFKGTGGAALINRIGFGALAVSTAYDLVKSAVSYQSCMTGGH